MSIHELIGHLADESANYETFRDRALHDVEDLAGEFGEVPEAHSSALVFAVLALAEAVREQGGKP